MTNEGRLSLGAVEGREELSSQGDDFERSPELADDGDLLCDKELGSCFDDALLLAGDCGLLFEDFDLVWYFEDFPLLLEAALLPVIGNGGNAQSRFVSSGEGGRRGAAIAGFLCAFHGGLRADVALTGEPMEPLPLLAGVSSPANGPGTR